MWYLYLLGGYYLIGVSVISVIMYRNPEIFNKDDVIELTKTFYEETRFI